MFEDLKWFARPLLNVSGLKWDFALIPSPGLLLVTQLDTKPVLEIEHKSVTKTVYFLISEIRPNLSGRLNPKPKSEPVNYHKSKTQPNLYGKLNPNPNPNL